MAVGDQAGTIETVTNNASLTIRPSEKFYVGRLCVNGHRYNDTPYSIRRITDKRCITCSQLYHKGRYINNRERLLNKEVEYYYTHRDYILEKRSIYYVENRAKIIEYNNVYYNNNRHAIIQHVLKYSQTPRGKISSKGAKKKKLRNFQ